MGLLAGLAGIVALFAGSKSKQKVKEIKKDIKVSKKKVKKLKSDNKAIKETQKNHKKAMNDIKKEKQKKVTHDVSADEAASFLKRYTKKKK
jgi:outer membrane murein-binding lipoprotein Lpp